MTEQQMVVALTLIMVVLAGLFLLGAATIWLRNNRERRAWELERAEIRKWDANAAEREAWVSCIGKKDDLIAGLQEEVLDLSKKVERNTQIMKKAKVADVPVADS